MPRDSVSQTNEISDQQEAHSVIGIKRFLQHAFLIMGHFMRNRIERARLELFTVHVYRSIDCSEEKIGELR